MSLTRFDQDLFSSRPARSDSENTNAGSPEFGSESRPAPSMQAARADSPSDSLSVSGVLDAIVEIGHQRGTLLAQMRAALESGRDKDVLVLARRLCGLSS